MTGVRRGSLIAALCAGVLVGSTADAHAQAPAPRLELGIGGMLAGATSVGRTDAIFLAPDGSPLTLFRTTNRITGGAGVLGHAGLRITERMRAELAIGWVGVDLESRVTGDFEDASSLAVRQGMNQFSAEAALAYFVIERNRYAVFVRGGAGGFRELTDDRALIANGWRTSLGGGTRIWIRQSPSGFFGQLALRVDARIQIRQQGVPFGNTRPRVSPEFVAGLVIGR